MSLIDYYTKEEPKLPKKYQKDVRLIKQSFLELFPNKNLNKNIIIKYSGRFKGYNANVYHNTFRLEFNLSKQWRGISEEIKMGLFQTLLTKIYKTKQITTNIDLYNKFLKNVHIAIPKKDSDPQLLQRFNIINEKYFYGLLDPPNLQWGKFSKRQMGTYEYATDKIVISRVLQNAPIDLLDYVLYHEMLHKKHKFKQSGTRSYHHTKEFKADERKFENYSQMEKRLSNFLAKYKIKKWFFS